MLRKKSGSHPRACSAGETGRSVCSRALTQSLCQGAGDFFLLDVGDAREKGQGEGAPGDGFSQRKRDRNGAGMALPSGLQVYGGEVAASGDAMIGETGAEAIAVGFLRQANDIDEPADGATRERGVGEFEIRDGGEESLVALSGGVTEGENFVDAGELDPAQCAGQLGETVVVAGLGVIQPVGARPALIA